MNRIAILIALLVLVVAGCASGDPAATDEASEPTATEEPTPEPTPEESDEPVASLAEGAGDLADVLPDEIAGIAIQYQHTTGADVIGSEGMTPEALAFFDRVGAEASDLSSAFGFAIDPESGSVISIVAFRVAGADEGRLRTEFLATMAEAGDTVSEEETVGGKTVQAFGDTDSAQGYVYVKDDVVYIVGGEPISIAEEALAALP